MVKELLPLDVVQGNNLFLESFTTYLHIFKRLASVLTTYNLKNPNLTVVAKVSLLLILETHKCTGMRAQSSNWAGSHTD